jgi:hypothetical protein
LIKEELNDVGSDFLLTISLLEVLQRAVHHSDDAELWASLRITIGRFHEVHDRLDMAIIRIGHEGAPRTIRTVRS